MEVELFSCTKRFQLLFVIDCRMTLRFPIMNSETGDLKTLQSDFTSLEQSALTVFFFFFFFFSYLANMRRLLKD